MHNTEQCAKSKNNNARPIISQNNIMIMILISFFIISYDMTDLIGY